MHAAGPVDGRGRTGSTCGTGPVDTDKPDRVDTPTGSGRHARKGTTRHLHGRCTPRDRSTRRHARPGQSTHTRPDRSTRAATSGRHGSQAGSTRAGTDDRTPARTTRAAKPDDTRPDRSTCGTGPIDTDNRIGSTRGTIMGRHAGPQRGRHARKGTTSHQNGRSTPPDRSTLAAGPVDTRPDRTTRAARSGRHARPAWVDTLDWNWQTRRTGRHARKRTTRHTGGRCTPERSTHAARPVDTRDQTGQHGGARARPVNTAGPGPDLSTPGMAA